MSILLRDDHSRICIDAGAPEEPAAVQRRHRTDKSTLLREIYRHLRPVTGAILVGEEDVWRCSPRQAAQRTAAVPQERPADFAVTVAEMVGMGRTPHKRPFAGDSVEDRAMVAKALEQVGLTALAGRSYLSLSGGEKQRVLVARALAQQAQVLILDEPTNHLDVRYQLELLELVRDLDLTVIMAMHDLNLAATYCDRLHVIASGRLVTSGTPSEVLTEDLLRDVFSVGAEITLNARNAKLQLCFYPLTPVDKSAPESICSTQDRREFT
jgi:iron complex transport system ATP-binding protein